MIKFLKNILIILLVTLNLVLNTSIVKADETEKSYLERQNFTDSQKQKPLTMKWLFIFYFNALWEWIPDSYKYIDLKFLNIEKDTTIYDALQRWVYLNLINNKPIDLKLNSIATEDFLAKLITNNFDTEVTYTKWKSLTLNNFLNILTELKNLDNARNNPTSAVNIQPSYEINNSPTFAILNDIYSKLKKTYYNSDKITESSLINWAIKWMVETSWDKHTVYFPPVDSKNFMDQLSWEFDWIWAHVEMDTPWILKIVSPISGSPAEKSWLRAWDQIIKVDDFLINSWVTLELAVSKIKWPSWTDVNLTILRDGINLVIKVTRAKITVKYVDYSRLENWDNYIKVALFSVWIAREFSWAVDEVIKNVSPGNKTIIDLRNNPWWSLDEVSSMLDFFVPKWQNVVNIKYKNYSSDIVAAWLSGYSFLDKKVIILINKWSASASEIMAWTIKDYLWDNVKIIWETSYGKWSVQTIDNYFDWSSFKYTVAKWFTGKTKTWIDWVWIKPDIELKLDEDKFMRWQDNQLEYAKNYRF